MPRIHAGDVPETDIFCAVCNWEFPSREALSKHLRGAKHTATLAAANTARTHRAIATAVESINEKSVAASSALMVRSAWNDAPVSKTHCAAKQAARAPEYRRLLQRKLETTATQARGELARVVERASAVKLDGRPGWFDLRMLKQSLADAALAVAAYEASADAYRDVVDADREEAYDAAYAAE